MLVPWWLAKECSKLEGPLETKKFNQLCIFCTPILKITKHFHFVFGIRLVLFPTVEWGLNQGRQEQTCFKMGEDLISFPFIKLIFIPL